MTRGSGTTEGRRGEGADPVRVVTLEHVGVPGRRSPEWEDVESFVRRLVRSRMRGIPEADQDDVISEVFVSVVRFSMGRRPRSLRRIASKAARWKLKDYWKRRKHLREREAEPPDENHPAPEPPMTPQLDPLWERARFEHLELLRLVRAVCWSIARELYREGRSLLDLAVERGVTHAAMRQEWSRCMKRIREIAEGLDCDLRDLFHAIVVERVFDPGEA